MEIDDNYTPVEQVRADVIAKWIRFYAERGLDPKLVIPESIVVYHIVKEISELEIKGM